jgi:hypothetical protein
MTPWTDPHSPWTTQAAFMTWLRGMLRRGWTRYPTANAWKRAMSRPAPKGYRAKRVGDCCRCRGVFPISRLEVDHVDPAGALNTEDIGTFVLRLFTTSDKMRLLCVPCHRIITSMERFKCTEREAIARAEVMIFVKLSPADQTFTLQSHGCPEHHLANAAKRRAAYQHFHETGTFEGLPGPPEHRPSRPHLGRRSPELQQGE